MLPPVANYPIVIKSIDVIEMVMEQVNQQTKDYENWQLIMISVLTTYLAMKAHHFVRDLDEGLFGYLKKQAFLVAKRIPFLNAQIMKELQKTQKDLEEEIFKANKGNLYMTKMPETGIKEKELFSLIDNYLKMSGNEWKSGALSGCVYGANDQLTQLTTKVYEKFAWSNPMHADVFPDVRKMEAEVVRWVCDLFNGDQESCGTMTTGGTESIMLACKAYRDLAYSKGIKRPEMVVPVTAHAAFDKAAHFFRIKINHVPVDPAIGKVNPKKLASYINSNTCMVGSN